MLLVAVIIQAFLTSIETSDLVLVAAKVVELGIITATAAPRIANAAPNATFVALGNATFVALLNFLANATFVALFNLLFFIVYDLYLT